MNEAVNPPAEGRRDFFKTLGRGLVLGVTGVGMVAMAKSGRLNLSKCIDEHGPCRTCVAVTGCSLPKADAFKRSHPHG